MSIKFSVLLYSKYSKFSTEIVSQVNQYQNVFIENFNMKLLCIDNEVVRKRITSSKKINISFVPSILVIYEDGGVERVLTLTKQQEEQQQQVVEQQEENLEDTEIEEEEEIKPKKITKKVIQKKPPPKKQSTSSSKKNVPKNKTSIEDLEDLDDLEQNEYEEENNIFEHQMIEQVESTNAMTAKKNDLLSLAAEMQKSRDSFEKTNEKPRF
jgi:hypothetical protein